MIEPTGLSKNFGRTRAVDDLTCSIESGVVTGFLGPNGAGKSTTMRMIVGLDRPSAGTATVDGQKYRDLKHPLRRVGVLLDGRQVHPNRTARSHLRWIAASNRLPVKRVGPFSLGMAQRLGVAAALLGDPAVLLFDEPANGLDPEGIRWIRTLMRSLARGTASPCTNWPRSRHRWRRRVWWGPVGAALYFAGVAVAVFVVGAVVTTRSDP